MKFDQVENIYIDASGEHLLIVYVQFKNGSRFNLSTHDCMIEAAEHQKAFQWLYEIK